MGMQRQTQLNINFTSCKDCEKHEYFSHKEPICKDDYCWYLSNEHTRKRFKKTKRGKWSIFPMYTFDYTIDKQLTDMEYKRQNWDNP